MALPAWKSHSGLTSPAGNQAALTLGAHQDHGDLTSVAIVGHAAVVVVNSLEADFILQAEHKDNSIHPHGKLRDKNGKGQLWEEQLGGGRKKSQERNVLTFLQGKKHTRKTHNQPRPHQGDKLLKWWLSSPCKPWGSGIHKGLPHKSISSSLGCVTTAAVSAHWVWFPENTAGWDCWICALEMSSTPMQHCLSPMLWFACMHADVAGSAGTGTARNPHILIHVQKHSFETSNSAFSRRANCSLLASGTCRCTGQAKVQWPYKWEAFSSQVN